MLPIIGTMGFPNPGSKIIITSSKGGDNFELAVETIRLKNF